MTLLDGLRKRLARSGMLRYGRTFSPALWGATRDSLAADGADADHGLEPGCDAWPVHALLRRLAEGRPLGFAHFNDGECQCLLTGWHRSRDGIENCTSGTRSALSGALDALAESEDPRVREGFVLGLPCPRCHGPKGVDVLRRWPGLQGYARVTATVLHHAVRWARPRMAAALRARGGEVFLTCSTEHDVAAVEGALGLGFADVLRVDRFHAHERPEAFEAWREAVGWGARPDGPPRTLLLASGVMSRPWAVRAFLADPESVVLSLGSWFDDVALGRTLAYARDGEIRCRRCLRTW